MSLGATIDPASPAPTAVIPPIRLRRLRPKSVRGVLDVCPTFLPLCKKSDRALNGSHGLVGTDFRARVRTLFFEEYGL